MQPYEKNVVTPPSREDPARMADQLAALWACHGEDDYTRLVWQMGSIVRKATENLSPAQSAKNCRLLIKLLDERRSYGLDDSQLLELAQFHRLYPDRPPALDWNLLQFLIRIEDPVLRHLYQREAAYRGWSGPHLSRQIDSSLFSSYRPAIPRLRRELGEILTMVNTPTFLWVVRSEGVVTETDPDPMYQLREARLVGIRNKDGENLDLGTFHCRLGSTYALNFEERLWISTSSGLSEYNDGPPKLLIESGGWILAGRPTVERGVIAAVWKDPRNDRFKVSVFEGARCRWSEVFEGYAVAAVTHGEHLIVRVDPSRATSRLVRINLSSLRTTAIAPMRGPSALHVHGDQLFSGDQVDTRVDQDVELYRNRQPPILGSDQLQITSMVGSGEVLRRAVSCLNPTTLNVARQWELEEDVESMQVLPEGRGLLVTCSHSILGIVPNKPRPVVLARWNGATIGKAVQIDTRLCWLTHRNNKRYSYEWTEHDNEYVVEVLDSSSGRRSFVPINIDQKINSMELVGKILIFAGSRELVTYDALEFLGTAVEDVLSKTEPLQSYPGVKAAVSGLPMAGPVTQQWIGELSGDLIANLVPMRFRSEFETYPDGNKRFELWQHCVSEDIASVRRWPSFLKQVASQCPPEFTALTSAMDSEDETSPAFGSETYDWSEIERVIKWKQAKESAVPAVSAPEEGIRCARVLLYEYLTRCVTKRSLHTHLRTHWGREGTAIANAFSTYGLDSMAWLNLGQLRPPLSEKLFYFADLLITHATKPACGLGLAWIGSLVLGDVMPAALKKLAAAGFPIFGGAWLLGWLLTILKVCYDKKRISLDTFQSFLANRPTGCPPLLSDATGFVQYVQECAREKLLDSGGRDAIQMALATAWEHPLLTNGNLVFISYSHKQAAIARRLADALRALGVGAILDQDELQKESCDTVVDMWIAESLMRSVTSIYLVSDDVQYSGWVFREAEWQFRVLGIKTSLVLPYVVTFGKAQDYLKYPPSRTIQGSDLLDRFDETVQRLAARIILDWLLMLRSKAEKKHFGIAYRGKPPVYEIVVPPTFTTSSDKAE